MKILVDQNVPLKLIRLLTNHTFITRGIDEVPMSDTDLILTCSSTQRIQDDRTGWPFAVLELSTNHWPTLKEHVAKVQAALDKIKPGEFLR